MVCPGQQMAATDPGPLSPAGKQASKIAEASPMTNYIAQLANWRPWFRADWTRFLFVHYSLPPEELAPYTPFNLDCREGRAFVSLVFFRFDRMRPARFVPDMIGRT